MYGDLIVYDDLWTHFLVSGENVYRCEVFLSDRADPNLILTPPPHITYSPIQNEHIDFANKVLADYRKI